MSAPFTLRSAAGLPSEPDPIASSVVVVIDAQEEYASGALPLPDLDAANTNIIRIQAAARAAGAPVVHVAHVGSPGGAFDPASGGAILDVVAPHDGEAVIEKSLPNSFANTTLHDHLRSIDAEHLVIVGFMTHMCVSATARAAVDLGYRSTVVSDATATRSLPSATGGDPIDARVVHDTALAELADRFSIVATTDDVLDA